MPLVTWIGSAAALASTVSFIPQAWKIIQTGKTTDISTGMYAITVSAFALWMTYGLMLRQWPLVASNGICLLVSAFILVMKLLPRAATQRVSRAIRQMTGGGA
jgi:MtN3 and saliva related transmembrane protein